MKAIEPVIVELQCGQQHERAHGKTPCASRSNANIVASDRTVGRAHTKALIQAKSAGWRLKQVRTNGMFRAMVCPACLAFMERK